MNGQVDWFRVGEFGILTVTFAFGIWRSWVHMSNRLNAYGKRVGKVEENCVAYNKDIENMKLEQDRARNERDAIRTVAMAAGVKADALQQELTNERLAVMSTLHQNETAAAERDANLRERLARMDERLNVRAMVTQVVREMKDGER